MKHFPNSLLVENKEDAVEAAMRFFSLSKREKARKTRGGNDLVSRFNGHLFSRTGDITHTRAWEPENGRAEGNDLFTDMRREINVEAVPEEICFREKLGFRDTDSKAALEVNEIILYNNIHSYVRYDSQRRWHSSLISRARNDPIRLAFVK